MKRILVALLIAATALSPIPALAAQSTTQLAIKDGAGASQNLNETVIGGNFLPQITLCDPITVNTCAPISATTGLTVNGTVAATQSGTWNIGTVTTVTTLSTLTTLTNPVGIKGADGSAISSNSNPVPVSIQSGASSGTEYTEDAPAAANPAAGGLICVRRDTLSTSEVSADGDNVACKSASTGAIVVIASDVNGTKADFTTPSSVAGSTAHDGAGGSVNPLAIGGYASAAAPTDVSADADIVRAWNLRNGARATVLTAAGALIGGDATNGLDVDVTRLSALVAGSALIGKVGLDQTTPGTTNAVSLAQIGGTTIVNGGVAGSQSVGGTVATNVAITANPLNLGAQAVSSENAAVTTARQVQLVADLVGKLIVLPYSNPENFVSGVITSAMTGTTSTSLVAAPASGLRNYITQITCSNAHATVGTDIIVQDGNGGTTYYILPAAAVYGGAVLPFLTPLRQPTTATAVYVANVTTGASTKCAASGYKGA